MVRTAAEFRITNETNPSSESLSALVNGLNAANAAQGVPWDCVGYGRSLLAKAEAEAKARGCLNAHLDTFDFQALGFYERLGYRIFGKLAGYPGSHTRLFLEKRGL